MESKVISYPGVDVTVTYDLKRCIHAAECVKGLPAVFNPDKKPWVDPDLASADEVAEVIGHCPTGALKYKRHDDGAEEPIPTENAISIVENGPLYVRGDVTIYSSEGEELLKDTRIALCRCGASKNKPLCDMAHNKAGFKDVGGLGEVKFKQIELEPGTTGLKITLANNGPLLLEGAVTLSSADGQASAEGSKGALCRCGASANKPFCDGTHKSIGFEG